MPVPVQILVTGGTIDKEHDPKTEALVFSKDGASNIPLILERAYSDVADISFLLNKDSGDFDSTDRGLIIEAVRASHFDRIVITHGTTTMATTAAAIAEHVNNKTVILTGALRPYALGRSDGAFNVGAAIIAAQLLPAGVYGVMNGRVFPATGLVKDEETSRFDTLGTPL